MWKNNTKGRARLARGRAGLVDGNFGTNHMIAARKAVRIKDDHNDFRCTAGSFSCLSFEVVPNFLSLFVCNTGALWHTRVDV